MPRIYPLGYGIVVQPLTDPAGLPLVVTSPRSRYQMARVVEASADVQDIDGAPQVGATVLYDRYSGTVLDDPSDEDGSDRLIVVKLGDISAIITYEEAEPRPLQKSYPPQPLVPRNLAVRKANRRIRK